MLGLESNIASALFFLGQLPAAAEAFTRLLQVRSRVLGSEHPDCLSAMGNLAETRAALGDHGAAIAMLLQARAIMRRVLGEAHPDTVGLDELLAKVRQAQSAAK